MSSDAVGNPERGKVADEPRALVDVRNSDDWELCAIRFEIKMRHRDGIGCANRKLGNCHIWSLGVMSLMQPEKGEIGDGEISKIADLKN